MMVLNPESQDEATDESVTVTLPQQTTISPSIELLIITVVKQLERLISAMFLDTAFAMEQTKRKNALNTRLQPLSKNQQH
jgi:tagatose-1,6-bisphosphate aldolase